MKLSDKIIFLRKQKGWSQEELAAQMDVSRQSVSKWESGASVPDIDKILLLSQIFGTTTDFLLKDAKEPSAPQEDFKIDSIKKEVPKQRVTKQEAENFLALRKSSSQKIAFGVWLCVISPALMMTLLGFSQYTNSRLTDELATAIGLIVLFVLVTIAVSLFIENGIALSKYEYIEKEAILIDQDLECELRKESEAFLPLFSKEIATGVVLCIMSVIPLVTFSVMENELMILVSVSILLLIAACGVYRFIKAGIIKGSYDQLLQTGDYSIPHKKATEKLEPISSVYWLSSTIIYLVISFLTNRWDITWIIWVVAGIGFAILSVILRCNGNGNLKK